jgi:hypothetical protein
MALRALKTFNSPISDMNYIGFYRINLRRNRPLEWEYLSNNFRDLGVKRKPKGSLIVAMVRYGRSF